MPALVRASAEVVLMDWLHETHRKLYTRVDGKWTRHPLSARGLGSELLKYVDEDGCIYLARGESPADAIFRTTQALPNERKRVLADVAALLEDLPHDPAYLVHELALNRVRIRNFSPAQGIVEMTAEERSEARSKEAIRAAEYRKRRKEEREAFAAPASVAAASVTERDDRHDARHDGDRDGRRDGDRDDRHDGDRDGRARASAGAGTHAYAHVSAPAGAPPPASRSVPSVPSPTTTTTARAAEVWEGLEQGRERLAAVADDDLRGWAKEVGFAVDLPPAASLAPYVRRAMLKLGELVTAKPETPTKDRLAFVSRTTVGLVNQDKANGWASGRTDGREGVCAPPNAPSSGPRQGRPLPGSTVADNAADFLAAVAAGRPPRRGAP